MDNEGRHLPNKLKKIRRLFEYSQKHASELLKIDPADLSRYENGSTNPNIENLFKLASLYKTPIEQLYPALFQRARKAMARRKAAQAATHEKIKKS